METISPFTWGLIAASIIAFLVAAICVHVIEWRLYVIARTERDAARAELTQVKVERDGWRNVAQRALVVAQTGRRVSARASAVITRAKAQ